MKWLRLLLICIVACLGNACEKHAAAEQDEAAHGTEGKIEPGGMQGEDRKGDAPKNPESPKIFPEAK